MQWIQIITLLVTNLPAIWKIVKELIEIFRDMPDKEVRRQMIQRFGETLKACKEKGDYAAVHALLDEMRAEIK